MAGYENDNNESNGVYICNDCGKSFATDDVLKFHANSEHPVRTYSCHMCGHATLTPKDLEAHLMTHPEQQYLMELQGKTGSRVEEVSTKEELVSQANGNTQVEVGKATKDCDANSRPPVSYASLIAMALRDLGGYGTLQQIYKSITDKYPYYARLTAEEPNPAWQNSIRQNLSSKEEFVKVGDRTQNQGKGHHWTIKQDLGEKRLARLFGVKGQRKSMVKRTEIQPQMKKILQEEPSDQITFNQGTMQFEVQSEVDVTEPSYEFEASSTVKDYHKMPVENPPPNQHDEISFGLDSSQAMIFEYPSCESDDRDPNGCLRVEATSTQVEELPAEQTEDTAPALASTMELAERILSINSAIIENSSSESERGTEVATDMELEPYIQDEDVETIDLTSLMPSPNGQQLENAHSVQNGMHIPDNAATVQNDHTAGNQGRIYLLGENRAEDDLKCSDDHLQVARVDLNTHTKDENCPEQMVLGEHDTQSWIARETPNELIMSSRINGDSADGNLIVKSGNNICDKASNICTEQKEDTKLTMGKKKVVDEIGNALKVTKIDTNPQINSSDPANQNEMKIQPEMGTSPNAPICSVPLLSNSEPELSSRGISALRKESSAHKVYKAYDNSRRAWLKKDILVRELWLHYKSCHKIGHQEDGSEEKITVIKEMNGNSGQGKVVKTSTSGKKYHDNQNNQKTQKHQIKARQDQALDEDVNDPIVGEMEDKDMSENSVDDDILDFLDE